MQKTIIIGLCILALIFISGCTKIYYSEQEEYLCQHEEGALCRGIIYGCSKADHLTNGTYHYELEEGCREEFRECLKSMCVYK